MEVLIGKVSINKDWEGDSYRDYMEVSDLNDSKDTLDDRLVDYNGMVVKVTIEVINKL
ncbi:hypothetical protein J7E55_11895 [Bacillus sp. ISL-53]|nr:hypothetical protein [Bacillus sp. ISL-53]